MAPVRRTTVVLTLAVLSRRTANVRDSALRLEFDVPLEAHLTQYKVAVGMGNLECGRAKRLWQTYVNDTLIPMQTSQRTATCGPR
jgi:hypothetical protein